MQAKHMLHPARLLRPAHTPSLPLTQLTRSLAHSPRTGWPHRIRGTTSPLGRPGAASGGVFRCSATSDLGRPGKINGLPAELQEGI